MEGGSVLGGWGWGGGGIILCALAVRFWDETPLAPDRRKKSSINFHARETSSSQPRPSGYMGGCQNYDPFLGTPNNRCRIIIGIQKGIVILTTTHMIVALVLEQLVQHAVMMRPVQLEAAVAANTNAAFVAPTRLLLFLGFRPKVDSKRG